MKKGLLSIGLGVALLVSLFLGGVGQGYAKELPRVNWTLQTTWAQGWLLHQMAEDFAKRVKEMSGGQFTIKVLPAGAVVGGLEVMDAASAGTIDAFHSWTGYWMGKHPSAPFFSSIPMGFEPLMHTVWLYAGGGKEHMQQMYDEMGKTSSLFRWCDASGVLAHSNSPSKKCLIGRAEIQGTGGGEILKGMASPSPCCPGRNCTLPCREGFWTPRNSPAPSSTSSRGSTR